LNGSASQESSTAVQTIWRKLFLGPNGLRAGWAALLFVAIFAAEFALVRWLHGLLSPGKHPRPTSMAWGAGLLQEAQMLAMLPIPLFVLARIERKPIAVYGYRGQASASRFCFGLLWGFAAISALIGVLWKLGYLAFDGPLLAGPQVWQCALGWGVVFIVVALLEESLLRGYLQFTLARGLGFWWAALILSCLFGVLHGSNPGESPVGLIGVGAVGLVFSLSLWYTGSLWWAIGFHAAWDWGQSFFYGTADSGLIAEGHLLQEHAVGNPLWSGGTDGPEGSILALALLVIVTAAMFLWWGKHTVSPFAGTAWKPRRVEDLTRS